jgi:hypothetical protein
VNRSAPYSIYFCNLLSVEVERRLKGDAAGQIDDDAVAVVLRFGDEHVSMSVWCQRVRVHMCVRARVAHFNFTFAAINSL